MGRIEGEFEIKGGRSTEMEIWLSFFLFLGGINRILMRAQNHAFDDTIIDLRETPEIGLNIFFWMKGIKEQFWEYTSGNPGTGARTKTPIMKCSDLARVFPLFFFELLRRKLRKMGLFGLFATFEEIFSKNILPFAITAIAASMTTILAILSFYSQIPGIRGKPLHLFPLDFEITFSCALASSSCISKPQRIPLLSQLGSLCVNFLKCDATERKQRPQHSMLLLLFVVGLAAFLCLSSSSFSQKSHTPTSNNPRPDERINPHPSLASCLAMKPLLLSVFKGGWKSRCIPLNHPLV